MQLNAVSRKPHMPGRSGAMLVNFLKFSVLLSGVIGLCHIYAGSAPNRQTRWAPAVTSRPNYYPSFTSEAYDHNPTRAEARRNFLALPAHPPPAAPLSPANCSVAAHLREELRVEHWYRVATETVWDTPARYTPQANLQVIGFHLAGAHYCFASAGLVPLYDSIYSFSVGTEQIAVSYWALKDRVRVLTRTSDEPIQWGIVGVTHTDELVISVDGQAFSHDAPLPLKDLAFEETTQASWLERFPDTLFCACRVESL